MRLIFNNSVYYDRDTCGGANWIITASINNPARNIVKIEYFLNYYGILAEEYDYPDGVSEINLSFYLDCFPGIGTPLVELYDVWVTLDNGVQCYYFLELYPGFCCSGGGILRDLDVTPNPDLNGDIIVSYTLNMMPAGAVKVSVIDLQGIEQLLIHDGDLTSLTGQFFVDVSHLQTGYYFLKFEAVVENESTAVFFIKQ